VRRGQIVQLTLWSFLYAGIASAIALLIPWLPTAASREAGRIHFVYWFVTGISIAVFAVVAAVLTYELLHFRATPGDDSDGAPIHGHTTLEIVWTAIPALLVTAISIVSAIVLAKNDSIPKNHITVVVTGQQFAWTFKYPEYGNLQTTVLRLPIGKSADLEIHSVDVLHSFWVPEFSQKQDAVPGSTNHIKVTPDKLGTFPVMCTELCGLGHGLMRSEAIVMKAADFEAWAKKSQTPAPGGGRAANGAAVFKQQGCGSCHTLKAANASGNVGPDLDKLPQYAKEADKPLEAFIRESIVDPNAYIQKGFPKNVMPTTFKDLPPGQLDALVSYLVQSSRKGG